MIRALVQGLRDVFEGGFYADKVLERAFKKNKKWGSRDRRFLAETLYDMVRWWGFLCKIDEGSFIPSSEDGYLARWVVYEIWKNKINRAPQIQKHFSNFKWDQSNLGTIEENLKSENLLPWDLLSYPHWLYERFKQDYGNETEML